MTAASTPTIIDLDALGPNGSIRIEHEKVTRGYSLGIDFLDSANRIIRQSSALNANAQVDLVFSILGERLNSILIRACELDDPVLKTILNSIGMFDGETARPVRLSSEHEVRVPGFGLASDEQPSIERLEAVASQIEQGAHHGDGWTLAITAAHIGDNGFFKSVATAVRTGILSSDDPTSPWRLYIAKAQ